MATGVATAATTSRFAETRLGVQPVGWATRRSAPARVPPSRFAAAARGSPMVSVSSRALMSASNLASSISSSAYRCRAVWSAASGPRASALSSVVGPVEVVFRNSTRSACASSHRPSSSVGVRYESAPMANASRTNQNATDCPVIRPTAASTDTASTSATTAVPPTDRSRVCSIRHPDDPRGHNCHSADAQSVCGSAYAPTAKKPTAISASTARFPTGPRPNGSGGAPA